MLSIMIPLVPPDTSRARNGIRAQVVPNHPTIGSCYPFSQWARSAAFPPKFHHQTFESISILLFVSMISNAPAIMSSLLPNMPVSGPAKSTLVAPMHCSV